MEHVSIPRAALAARWRPVNHAPLQQAWRPAPAQMAAPLPPSRLGQIHPLSVVDVGMDFATAAGAMLVGFSFALFGPKDAPTWRWIGGLTGAIGAMRILHNVSKLGV
jgi:hypothetical protein